MKYVNRYRLDLQRQERQGVHAQAGGHLLRVRRGRPGQNGLASRDTEAVAIPRASTSAALSRTAARPRSDGHRRDGRMRLSPQLRRAMPECSSTTPTLNNARDIAPAGFEPESRDFPKTKRDATLAGKSPKYRRKPWLARVDSCRLVSPRDAESRHSDGTLNFADSFRATAALEKVDGQETRSYRAETTSGRGLRRRRKPDEGRCDLLRGKYESCRS